MKTRLIINISLIFCASMHAFNFDIKQLKPFDSQQTYKLIVQLTKQNMRLGIIAMDEGHAELVAIAHESAYHITDFADFVDVMKEFLAFMQTTYDVSIQEACIGVPGPSRPAYDAVQSHHHSFLVDGKELERIGLLRECFVVNDFELVAALSAIHLQNAVTLHDSSAEKILVNGVNYKSLLFFGIGDGVGSCLAQYVETGSTMPALLGVCYSNVCNPHDDADNEYLTFCKQTLGDNLSWGKLLGAKGGLRLAYEFVCKQHNTLPAAQLAFIPTEIIAHKDSDAMSKQAVDLFMKWYARCLRTTALMLLPMLDEVIITHDIAIEHPELFDQAFLDEYFDCRNPVLNEMLRKIPVKLIADKEIGLRWA